MKKTIFKPGFTATGMAAQHLPPGAESAEIMALIRLGSKFRRQQTGRKPGFLHNYVAGIVAEMSEPTFGNLLSALELSAARRDAGDDHEPIERVSRSWELVTVHGPKGEQRVTFGTLRNCLTKAKTPVFTPKLKP